MVPENLAAIRCTPVGRTMVHLAVPRESWLWPNTAEPLHCEASALQNKTKPGVTAWVPEVTDAVNVSAVPNATLVCETLRAVDVAEGAASTVDVKPAGASKTANCAKMKGL